MNGWIRGVTGHPIRSSDHILPSLRLCSKSHDWPRPLTTGKWSATKIFSPSQAKRCGGHAHRVRSRRGRESTSDRQLFPLPQGRWNSRNCGHSDSDRARSGPCLVPCGSRHAQRPVRSSPIDEQYGRANDSYWLARTQRPAKMVQIRAGPAAPCHSRPNAGLHDGGSRPSIGR